MKGSTFHTHRKLGSFALAVWLLVAVVSTAGMGLAEPVGHVVPGAFGEMMDVGDEKALTYYTQMADKALAKMLADFEADMAGGLRVVDGYLQILQTTVFSMCQEPDLATETERRMWAEYYADVECVVSFVVMDNYLRLGTVDYAEVTHSYGDYAVTWAGEVRPMSLRNIRARYFTDAIVRGTRVINLGDLYNQVYTVAVDVEVQAVP